MVAPPLEVVTPDAITMLPLVAETLIDPVEEAVLTFAFWVTLDPVSVMEPALLTATPMVSG